MVEETLGDAIGKRFGPEFKQIYDDLSDEDVLRTSKFLSESIEHHYDDICALDGIINGYKRLGVSGISSYAMNKSLNGQVGSLASRRVEMEGVLSCLSDKYGKVSGALDKLEGMRIYKEISDKNADLKASELKLYADTLENEYVSLCSKDRFSMEAVMKEAEFRNAKRAYIEKLSEVDTSKKFGSLVDHLSNLYGNLVSGIDVQIKYTKELLTEYDSKTSAFKRSVDELFPRKGKRKYE